MSSGLRHAWAGLLVAGAIAVTLMVREVRRSERADAALSLATQRRERAHQRMTLAEQTLARAGREPGANSPGASPLAGASAASTPTAATANAKHAAATGTGATRLSMRDGKIRPEVAEATDPELRALALQLFDAQFGWVWGPLLQQLNLPEEKVAALKALLRAHEERRMDVTAVAGEQQLELNDSAIQKMRNADGALLARQVRELLGPDDGAIYQQFRRDMAVYATIAGLAEANYRASTPLTGAESQQLRSILAAHSERMSNGFVRPNSVNWAAALADVERSGAFSTATVEGFRHVVTDEQMHRQISQRRNEIGTKLAGPAPGEIWVPNFPVLAPKPWTGSATIPKAH